MCTLCIALGYACLAHRPRPEWAASVELPVTMYGVLVEQDDGGLWVTVDNHAPRWIGPRVLAALAAILKPESDPNA